MNEKCFYWKKDCLILKIYVLTNRPKDTFVGEHDKNLKITISVKVSITTG